MKKSLRIAGLVVLFLVVAAAGFATFITARGIPKYKAPVAQVPAIEVTPGRVELGEKLVLASCADCHLNRATNTLAGQRLLDIPPDFGQIYSANITQDKTHGIGNWTDAQIVGLLRTGVAPDGRYRVVMPSFVKMSDEDVASIIAFLRSEHPMVQATPTPSRPQEPSFLLKALVNTVMKPTPMPQGPVVAPAPTNAVAYGEYLVAGRYKCYDCHSKDFKTNDAMEPAKSAGYLAGGNKMLNMKGETVVTRNITFEPETGIGKWSEAEFGRAVKYGISPNGPLDYPMPKYTRLSDEETHALYAYLQTMPKIKNATPEDGAVAAK